MSQTTNKSPIKLHHVLIIPFIILMSISVLLTSYLTWKYSEDTTTHLGHQISKQSAYLIEEKLDQYLSHADVANQSLQRVIGYGLIDTNNRSRTLEYIRYIVENDKRISTLSIAYPDGSYMGISNMADGTMTKKIASPKTDRIFYTYSLPEEKIIQEKPDYDARTRPWFIEAKDSQKAIWSSVFKMYSNNKLGVTYSEALHGGNNKNSFVGVVGTDVVFHDLNEQLDKIRLTDNSYLFIVDDENQVIAHSDLDKSKQEKSILYTVKNSHNPLLIQSVDFFHAHDDNIHVKPLHSVSEFTIDGETESYFVNYIPYGHGDGLDWHIGVVIPKSDFLGHINEVRKNTFLIWLVSFILSVCIGLLITYLINRAIKQLHNKLDQIENSGFMYEHDSHSIQEVNDLSMAFSRMSRRLYLSYLDLGNSNEELKNIVEKRTEALKTANIELKKQSYTDALTKLINRRSFDHFMEFYWDNLKNKQVGCLTLIVCDLDHFKAYNDIYGYPKGDDCLWQVAQIIESSVGELDISTRYGGDEFSIIMPDCSVDESLAVAKKIHKALAAKKIEHEKSETSKYVTISIGIATVSDTKMSMFELISYADDALCQAKKNGCNGYVLFEAD